MDENRRKRRRRRRIIVSALFLAVALGLAWFFESQATTTVVFVRYAETNGLIENPGLSQAGRERARELARVISDIDVVAGVDAIFATQYRSTQETAEPVAEALQIPVQVVDAKNIRGLKEMILKEYKRQIVLVITDTEALPALIRQFQGSKRLAPIADLEHDNLYIVSIPWYGKVKTLQLKYGTPFSP